MISPSINLPRTDLVRQRPKICPDDRELIEYDPVPNYVLFYEHYRDIFFYASVADIMNAKLLLNRLFATTGRAPISYFYDCLSISSSFEFDRIGWTKEDGLVRNYNFIDISEDFSTDKVPNEKEWFEIVYIVSPTYIGEEGKEGEDGSWNIS